MLIPLVLLAALAAPLQTSQNSSSAKPAEPAAARVIQESVLIPVVVKTSLYTKKTKLGETVTLESNSDVKSAEGELLVPKHAKLTGTVTLVEPKDKETKSSRLSIRITKAEWKDGSIGMIGLIGGQVEVPERSSQMISGGMNPHAATPLSSSALSPLVNASVERDDKLGTVLVGHKQELDIPKDSTMMITTQPE